MSRSLYYCRERGVDVVVILLPGEDVGFVITLLREDVGVGAVPLPRADVSSAVLPVAAVSVGCAVAILPGDEVLAVAGVPFGDVPGGDTVPTPREENTHYLELRPQH